MSTRQRPVTAGWIWLGLGIALFSAASILLGFWQLDRAKETAAENEVLAGRLASDPVPLDALILDGVEQADEDLLGWPVSIAGAWVADEQVLIRGRALGGTPGFWVVTPMVTNDGLEVLVNRGWVGLDFDDPLDPRLRPSDPTVDGVTMPGERHTGFGSTDPQDGHLAVLGILDIDRIGAQAGLDLEPVVVQSTSESGEPVPLPLPDTDDPGPHIAYVIQWFGFAAVASIGFMALAGRQLGRGPFARFQQGKESADVPIDRRSPEDGTTGRT